ncbi:MAG TPA: acetate--CoA ligase family protein [Acidimicrobiia bacterium]
MKSLDPMLRPRSVAVVGASERSGSVGDQTIRQLISGGFSGEIHPVNPSYESVHGLASHASLERLDGPIDLAVLAVANSRLETELEKAADIGARSAVIFASCHGDSVSGEPLRDRLQFIADEAGMPICGGNGMGFLNLEDRIRICGFYQPPDLAPGGVTFLSHSGSLFSAMLHNRRKIRFNVVVSTGLEINTPMDAYMSWALDLDSTKVLALFLETIRNPEGFRRALAQAERRDIPVVALKVGASRRAREAVATHSEGIAGDDAVYEALFDAHGVHRVLSMDEMVDTLELFGAGRRARGGGLGAVHDSGGERALLIDTADRLGVSLPTVGTEASARIAAVLDPGLEPANPVDAWGTGRDAEGVFVESLLALADDPAVGAVAFCVDLTPEEKPDDAYSNAAFTVAGRTSKPVAVLSNLATTVDPIQAGRLRDGGVPVLEGTETGVRAIGHLLAHHLRSELPPLEARVTAPIRLGSIDGERSALELLAGYGINIPRLEVVDDEPSLLDAAASIGFPCVLKTAGSTGHKTEAGGVILGLDDQAALVGAYRDMASRLGPSVMVAEQVSGGVEIALGMISDQQFGPVVLMSAGGTLIELLADRVVVLPRVDRHRARAALNRLRIRPLLDGHRGTGAVDLDELADVTARFSELVLDHADSIEAIDVNPLIAGPQGVVAVDALMKTR